MRRRAGTPGEQLGRHATRPPFPQRYAHSSQALKNSGGRSCPGCGRRRARAEADPGWAAARVPWAACLQKAGLEPHTDGWRSKQAQDMIMSENDVPTQGTQELSRIAYIEAKCNVESGLTQNLGNLEAGYQQPLIDANQAALNKVKEQAQQRLATAKAYI